MKVLPYPKAVVAEFRRLANEVLEEEGARSDLAKEIYASFKAFRDNSRGFQAVSEKAYLEARE